MTGPTWRCGGGCGVEVDRDHVCCRDCWHRAPAWLRARYATSRDADPWVNLSAGVDLLRWFRTHAGRDGTTLLRGVCPVCEREVLLRLDNTLRRHGGGYGRMPCAGSHEHPLSTPVSL